MSTQNFMSYGDAETIFTDVEAKKFSTGNVSTVQTTLTATKAYNQNDPFVYNGQLYKADEPIAQGDTIVISGAGQNASETTIEALISLHSGGVTGVKGNAEVSYRTGNVNMTPANVGAVASSNVKNTYQSSPTSGTEVYDAAYINELAGVESVKVIVSNSSTAGQVQTAWSSNPVSIAGDSTNTYYKKTITLSHAIYGIPEVKPKPSGNNKVMTDTEKGNYDCIDFYGLDPDYPTQLNLYAITKPTGEFYIWVIRDGGRV